MDQIRELVMSWRAMDIINIANGDEYVVESLLGLLGDEDTTTRLRALTAIGKLLGDPDGKIKSVVLKKGFNRLVTLLGDEDGRIVSRTLEVLLRLLEGVQIDENRLLTLIEASVPVAERGDTFIYLSLLELFRKLQMPPLSWRVGAKIDGLLNADNIYLRTLGMRLLLNSGSLDGKGKVVLGCITDLLTSSNVLLIEAGLDFLEEVLAFHLSPDMMKHLVRFLHVLKGLENGAESVLVRSRASSVRTEVERVLFSYYRSRTEEALEVIKELLLGRHVEEALHLALILGGTSLLLSLWTGESGDPDPKLMELLMPSRTP
ncbi:hypothetical protein [Thermococcus thioreducens]|uniref:HEAT repeat-containing protein n=1 Tax=Thermococcus thioreducens TaxID=277988 RepID=A0A0Q2REZ9_9EURY|nr:hypothetical protein [Thermococcus thioreducens]ASJ11684.1 hypothetical protein A3L14_01730 [Thermococcus thioreducens]KQH82582.1 hypothetical protein AMR53_04705 [Thermococcus thioreducens]SEW15625.1 hypothetical protein SAMN05216170_1935 [Thermococcus thioreducens]